jgi:predicted DNA-binding transcriptional regulator YafY
MAASDRLERLTDLVLVLLHTRTPRTLEEIAAMVPGYPQTPAARRQAFERDKRILRDEGIPVVTEAVEGPAQYGYRIDPDAFYLPALELSPDEQAALHLAVAGVHLGDPSGRDALAKLGASGAAETATVAQMDAPGALVPLFDALSAQAEVHFTYHGMPRAVAPSTLQFRAGRWYLVGWDRTREGARTFRVDRIESLSAPGPPGSGTLPVEFDVTISGADPWRVDERVRNAEGGGARAYEERANQEPANDERANDDVEELLIRVDTVEAPRVVAEVGERAVSEQFADGSVLLRLAFTNFAVLRSWVLGLLDHAEVIGPPAARRAVVSWLQEIAQPSAFGPVRSRERKSSSAPARVRAVPRSDAPSTRAQLGTARARLKRLLAIVAWLAETGEAPIAELAQRFAMSREEVVHELELAACCGTPPYSPDTLLEIVVSDERVQAFLPKDLSRPRRLTPAEGLALAASARTILAVPGADRDGALSRALRKLEAVLGDQSRLVIHLDAPPLLETLQDLAARGEQAEIVYHSMSTDRTTTRVVDPLDVVSLEGHWYLDACCQRAEGVRRFRIDRIRTVRPLGVPVERRPEVPFDARAFVPSPSAETVTVRLDGDARWVADSVPVLDEQPGPGSSVEVTLAVGGRAWLERLLLQAGPRARVVAPRSRTDVGPQAASRLLQRVYSDNMESHEREGR